LEQIIDITKFLDNSGKITQLSQKKKFRVATLCYLAEKFEFNHTYTEKEVNATYIKQPMQVQKCTALAAFLH